MTDDEIVDAVKDKHGIPLATGVYRQAHLDLVSMARADERHRIVAWLRDRKEMTAFYIDYVETAQAAAAIEAGEHLK